MATICAFNGLATLLTNGSSVAASHVAEIRHRTRAPSEGSRPMEFPPSGPDFEVVAGGMGWMVRPKARPATVDSWGATCLNLAYMEFRNAISFLNVLVMYSCLRHQNLARTEFIVHECTKWSTFVRWVETERIRL